MKSRTLTCITAMIVFAALAAPVLAAQVAGSGTTNFIPKWTGSTTLGNSTIFQSGGQVGIGTTSPAARLNVIGLKGTIGVNGGNAPTALQVSGSFGVTNSGGFGVQGAGGPIQFMTGTGASLPGFLARGGTGAVILITGGSGANCIPGATRCAAEIGGNGGSVTLQPGAGGFGRTSSGHSGNVLLAPASGNVGIGETSPAHTLEIKVGGTTLADAWTTRSARRFKTNIRPIAGALETVEQLQGVSYERRDDGKPEIGVVAEDVAQIVPALVSRDPETNEVQGVDYSRLAALLIEAVKAQQLEIQQLKVRVEELTRRGETFVASDQP